MDLSAAAPLYRSGCTSVYRARRPDGTPVVLKVIDSTRCRPRDLERLRNEYEIGRSLGLRGVVRPLALETREGLPTLVLEDFSDEPLDRLLVRPMETGRFLAVATAMAGALGDVHGKGVVHKDLKPRNILVHPESLEVRLADFGLATRLPREEESAKPPQLIEGSLPYLSPEQTGRMNRAVDARSDLYSLGVIFYQMLTARLPFEATDALEWIHCHVARPPPSPVAFVPDLPEALVGIVLKLLSKDADDRYQSARGLARDLERCLELWRARGHIPPFPLGERDVPDHLRLPQKLYGRREELFQLREALRRVVTTGALELVLVSGPAGVGKSSLVRELLRPLVPAHGLSVSGKCEQARRHVPYSGLLQACRELIGDVLALGEDELGAWRRRLQAVLGPNARVVSDVLPQLELVLDTPAPVPELPPAQAQLRFERVFRRFIGAFASSEHPAIVFLDDVQWADPGTLRLVEQLASDPEVRHLLLIAAYRHGEVGPGHPLAQAIAGARQAGATLRELKLAALSSSDLSALVADTLRSSRALAHPLAAQLHEKTGGNPLFAIQLLGTLRQEHLLTFDEATSAWQWDAAGIAAQGVSGDVVDLVVARLAGVAEPTRATLEVAACLGDPLDLPTLALVRGCSPEELQQQVLDGVRQGLLVCAAGRYRFAHDRVRESAYRLVPEAQRANVHLRIGRLLRDLAPGAEPRVDLFEVVGQLNLGSAAIADTGERRQLAELNLEAGDRAKTAHAHASAVAYLSAGTRLLGPGAWTEHPSLAYRLGLAHAESTLLAGDAAAGVSLAALVASRSRTRLERAAALLVEQQGRLLLGDVSGSVEVGLDALARLGVELPREPTWEDAVAERERVRRLLGDTPIEALAERRPMLDEDLRMATRFVAPSFYTNAALYCLHVARMVALCIEHGNPPGAVLWYGSFSFVLEGFFDAHREAARFARTALALMERGGHRAEGGNAHFFMVHASFWTGTLDAYVAHAQAGFEAGVEAGTPAVASYCRALAVLGMLTKGEPLEAVYEESVRCRQFQRSIDYHDMDDLVAVWQQFVRSLQGRTRALGSFDDERFGEERFEAELTGRLPVLVCWYWIWRMEAAFLAGDAAAALAAGERARPLLAFTGPLSPCCDFHVFHALALAAQVEAGDPAVRGERLAALAADRDRIARWAELNPGTFRHRLALVSAEAARVEGDEREAARRYEESLAAAREGHFVQDEALAFELAASFYRRAGYARIADLHLREARSCYLRWGAVGKVRELERTHRGLAAAASAAAPADTFVSRTEQIDLLSVVRACQAISGELVQEKLAQALMRVALAESGASRGCLVVARDGALAIEVQGAVDGRETRVEVLEGAAPSPLLVPISILQYVRRTGERVVLEDARRPSRFSDDVYLGGRRPRSVLALPILRGSELQGLLYLENEHLPGAFTPERLMVLDLLAVQSAISLETARLYQRTQQAIRARDEFLALAAHELRTPLTSLVMSVQTLERMSDGGMGEQARRTVGVAARQGRRLGRMLSDLLEASQLELSGLVLQPTEVDLATAAREAARRMAAELALAGCSLTLHCQEGVVGHWDAARVEQVVGHLLSNAMKFGGGHPVELHVARASATPRIARLAVSDHGIGIDPAQRARMFERFERGVSIANYGGLGLGLYLCRRIVEAHAGTIRIESDERAGTTLAVELPCDGPPVRAGA